MPRRTDNLKLLPARDAQFIEPMECLPVAEIPEGSQGAYEIKLDGYRAVAVKSNGNVNLYLRRKKSFNVQYPQLIDAAKRYLGAYRTAAPRHLLQRKPHSRR